MPDLKPVSDAEIKALQDRWIESLPKCPECGSPMKFKASFGGDWEGRGSTDIHQCPKCKNIEVE